MKKLTFIFLILFLAGCIKDSEDTDQREFVEDNPIQDESPSDDLEPETPNDPPVEDAPELDNYAELSWSAPSTRQDGTGIKMGELSHYVIAYGLDSENLSEVIMIGDASEKADFAYKIEDLEKGKWFFAIKVVDTEDLESPFSDLVSKTIY